MRHREWSAIERIIITIDDDPQQTVDALMQRRGYAGRLATVRDVIRDMIRDMGVHEVVAEGKTLCVAVPPRCSNTRRKNWRND